MTTLGVPRSWLTVDEFAELVQLAPWTVRQSAPVASPPPASATSAAPVAPDAGTASAPRPSTPTDSDPPHRETHTMHALPAINGLVVVGVVIVLLLLAWLPLHEGTRR